MSKARLMMCPYCRAINNAHEHVSRMKIRPGMTSVCWSCTKVSVFTKHGLRTATEEEQARIDASEAVQAVRAAVARNVTVEKALAELDAIQNR